MRSNIQILTWLKSHFHINSSLSSLNQEKIIFVVGNSCIKMWTGHGNTSIAKRNVPTRGFAAFLSAFAGICDAHPGLWRLSQHSRSVPVAAVCVKTLFRILSKHTPSIKKKGVFVFLLAENRGDHEKNPEE